ncbi:MAG: GntR family transcriptional regulator [Desulfobacterales bacterium]|nr:GntR family transcriptional regulator [Desulfobacterales bacterium]MDD4072104.1 GntR family transcriptional regulator [Desulfobacterales bacterium]MDD4392740.1 GntR family transcriptional regulator [Desulfobacterales bacterium]
MIEIIGVTEAATKAIRRKIISGKLGPSQKIVESELAENLGISRPSLREAFRILQQEGLLVGTPRKGMSVVDLSIGDLKHIYQFRGMVEQYAIETFNNDNLAVLEESIVETSDWIDGHSNMDTESLWVFRKKITDFHVALVQTLDNPYIDRSYTCLISNLARYHFLQFYSDGTHHSVEDHKKILKFLEQEQTEEAKRFLKEHLNWSYQSLYKIVSNKVINS